MWIILTTLALGGFFIYIMVRFAYVAIKNTR